jgi:integrase
VLGAILKQAVDDGYLAASRAAGLRQLKARHRPVAFYTVAEAERLIRFTPEPWRALIVVAAFAGLRQGEILALRWGDVDWHRNRLRVERSLQRREKLIDPHADPIADTKTRSGARLVPMEPVVREHLERHLHEHARLNPGDLIFPGETGQPLDAHNLMARVYRPAVERAGLRQLRFHDLRCTFVTYCAAAGVPQELVRDWVGHTETRMTEVYRATASSDAEAYGLDLLRRFREHRAAAARTTSVPLQREMTAIDAK